MNKYRGDTFIFQFKFKDSAIKFMNGDVITFAARPVGESRGYALYKKIPIEEDNLEEIEFRFESEETKKLDCDVDYDVEVKVIKDGITETSFRQVLDLKEVIIDE